MMGPLQTLRQDTLSRAVEFGQSGEGGYRGLCLKWVRTMFRIPAKYPSAIVAWNNVAASDRHGGKTPPAGVPVFWNVGKYGHIAISTGGGRCLSTDIKRSGKVDLVTIAHISHQWNARYLGWSETLNGERVISNREAG